MMTFDDAKLILAALEREGVEYVLVGAMGMAALGLVRGTQDLDFFVSPLPKNVDRLRKALKSVYQNDPNIDQITAEDLGGDYPAVQYVPPHGQYAMDILSRLGVAFHYEDLEWEEVDAEGVRVRVATPRMLYKMKKDTVRPQDRLDAEWIRRVFGLEEE